MGKGSTKHTWANNKRRILPKSQEKVKKDPPNPSPPGSLDDAPNPVGKSDSDARGVAGEKAQPRAPGLVQSFQDWVG